MKGPDLLAQHTDTIRTEMGGFVPGVRAVFRGHDLHTELKDMDWLDIYLFGITGRRFSKEQIRLMHAMFVYTSYPDPRIWNNRVSALAGSARSTGCLGVAASLAVSDAKIYGGGIYARAVDFFRRTNNAILAGGSLEECVLTELKTRRGIAGYGRPVVSVDERNAPLMKLARELGLADGPHVKLAHEVEAFLLAGRWRWRLNAAGLIAAFSTDFGLSPLENYLFLFPVFLGGMMPCYIEASTKNEGAFTPLSCRSIIYEGAGKRRWK
jgi:hypothetical protein